MFLRFILSLTEKDMAKKQGRRPLDPPRLPVRERGSVYFAYRPKIEAQVASGA